MPVVVQTPQSNLLTQIAQYAQQLAQNTYQWAQNTYAQTSALTEDNIAKFLDAANSAGGLASNQISRYQNVFQPLEDQLVKDANTYASDQRIQQAQGASEANVGQAMDTSRQNAERDLQAYGIDPSAGRYAALDKIARTQEGAAKAAAGTAAQLNTENTGRALRGQAIQVGQQYPAAAINSLNSKMQGVAGAENAVLGNANTGIAAMALPNSYLGTAMGLKLPNVGQVSGSSSAQRAQSNKPDTAQPQQQQGNQGTGAPKAPAAGGNTGPKMINLNPDAPLPQDPESQNQFDPGEFDQGYTPSNDWANANGDVNQNYSMDQGYTPSNDWSGANTDSLPDQSAPQTDWSQQNVNTTMDANNSQNWGVPPAPEPEQDGDGGGDDSFALGGDVGEDQQSALPMGDATTGGQVGAHMSPSGGQVQDDVNAHLNVDEFVIPKDVAKWKGEEFFHKLTAQAREARIKAQQTMGGKPSQRPTNGPATFRSQPMR